MVVLVVVVVVLQEIGALGYCNVVHWMMTFVVDIGAIEMTRDRQPVREDAL